MVQPHAVLEVSDGVLDLGVAPMVGLQRQGFPVPVGDEAVIAVGGEEGQLGTGRVTVQTWRGELAAGGLPGSGTMGGGDVI